MVRAGNQKKLRSGLNDPLFLCPGSEQLLFLRGLISDQEENQPTGPRWQMTHNFIIIVKHLKNQ